MHQCSSGARVPRGMIFGWHDTASGSFADNGDAQCVAWQGAFCTNYLYWNSYANAWQSRGAFTLSEAGGSAAVGVKAGMIVTAPQYAFMGGLEAAEAYGAAEAAAANNPALVQNLADFAETQSSPGYTPGTSVGTRLGNFVNAVINFLKF